MTSRIQTTKTLNEKKQMTLQMEIGLSNCKDKLKPKIQNEKESLMDFFISNVLNFKSDTIPRIQFLDLIKQLILENVTNPKIISQLFTLDENLTTLINKCSHLIDLVFIIEQHLQLKHQQQLGADVLNKISEQVIKMLDNCNNTDEIEKMLRVENIKSYLEFKHNNPKDSCHLLSNLHFHSQKKEVSKIYKYIFKPLFEKKSLKEVYNKITLLVYWTIMIGVDSKEAEALTYDLSKKINIFLLYKKTQANIDLITIFNSILDLLMAKYSKEDEVQIIGLVPLLLKLSDITIKDFIEMWLALKSHANVQPVEVENLFKNLTRTGCVSFSFSIIYHLSLLLKKARKYNILYNLFNSYIRKQYLQLKLPTMKNLHAYLMLIETYMIGFINRDRFQGEQIDVLTQNLTETIFLKKAAFGEYAESIIRIYQIYQNRFIFLNEPSKKFLSDLLQIYPRYKMNISEIHQAISDGIFRDGEFNEQEEGYEHYMQTLKRSQRYRGLKNLGNSCYINSFTQALFMTKKFRNLILELEMEKTIPSDKSMIYSLINIFDDLSVKDYNSQNQLAPDYFKSELPEPFRTSRDQQDVGEFGRIYIDSLILELQSCSSNIRERVEKICFHTLDKHIRCIDCKKEKVIAEKVFDFILNVDQNQDQIVVSKMLEKYFKIQQFDKENQIECSTCRKKKDAQIYFHPEKFRDVLIVTLGIFEFTGMGKKILKPLNFEFSLSFKQIFSSLGQQREEYYQLYAFIVHLGSQMSAGHYVCYARNLQENRMVWYCFDDSYVTEREIAKKEDFKFGDNETPYVLFYSLKGVNKNLQKRESLKSPQKVK